jgi:hypothetical protein
MPPAICGGGHPAWRSRSVVVGPPPPQSKKSYPVNKKRRLYQKTRIPAESWQNRWARLTGVIPACAMEQAALMNVECPPDRLEAVARLSGARLRSNENLIHSKKNREEKR